MSSISLSNISSSAPISSLSLKPSENEVGIWLIEDHEIYSRSLQRVIDQTPGMRCTGKYQSAELAFADLEAGCVCDLVLLDVQLPGMDGITALSGLKSMLPGVPVLILTVFDDKDKIFRAVSAGASGYVLKSSSMSEIAERIMRVVHGAVRRPLELQLVDF